MMILKFNLPADEVVAALKATIEGANMRIVSHINGQANAAKIGKNVPADQILEVFRPDFAVRVWAAYKPAGLDIPLRIHVYEDEDKHTVVQYRTAKTVFAPYQSSGLNMIAEELDTIFETILNSIEIQPSDVAHA